jgi:imidazolonepropionase
MGGIEMDLIIYHIKTLYTSIHQPPVKGGRMREIIAIDDAFVHVQDGLIAHVGQGDYIHLITKDTKLFDATGLIMVPGFVDAHTHLVHGGSREDEFALKLQGVDYLSILKSGGGILNTVAKPREATFQELFQQAKDSLDEMLLFGVTTLEAKSGYGLNLETEIKQLEVAKKLNESHPVEIVSTYLGAHAIPKDVDKATFLDHVINDLHEIRKRELARFVDVFCESGVFELEDAKKILLEAKKLGFIPRLHADEMTSLGGVGLGVDLAAPSVDHLMAITDEDIKRLAQSHTIANLLPATSFFLNKAYAPARKIIDSGAAVAISSDYNPGSTPSENYQFTMQISGTKLSMTPSEILTSATINPAFLLGLDRRIGSIEVGKDADLVLLKAKNLDYLIYHYGINHTAYVFKKGKMVVKKRQIFYEEA